MFEFGKECRYAGTAVPVFSLRTEKSAGVGDFGDLAAFVLWAEATGQHVIQILPVNDTVFSHSWTDSYPYSAVSTMALHPIYMNLWQMGTIEDCTLRSGFEKEASRLNLLSRMDYEAVMALKQRYFELIFEQDFRKVSLEADYLEFVERNSRWLKPYAEYRIAVDKGGEDDFHYFVQFHLDRQLRRAHEFANAHGVALKGDVPIGVARNSVEALNEPHYFNLDMQAGAPPDMFSADGQNWGFPTYNWERMAEDGYLWWRRRFGKMADYFDAFRIDHILGFFRIWEIPLPHKSGKTGHFSPALPYSKEEALGVTDASRLDECFIEDSRCRGMYHPRIDACDTDAVRNMPQDRREAFIRLYDDFFYHRHNGFWREEAMKKLPVLVASTHMLACAEDLGMVPDCVSGVLDELGILSLNVQRWPKEYKKLCVATTGTHDTSTLRGWWAEEHGGEDPAPGTCEGFLERCLASEAMLAILPLQDWLAVSSRYRVLSPEEERINDPSNPHHYWRYRMPVTVEELLKDYSLNEKIKTLINDGKRN